MKKNNYLSRCGMLVLIVCSSVGAANPMLLKKDSSLNTAPVSVVKEDDLSSTVNVPYSNRKKAALSAIQASCLSKEASLDPGSCKVTGNFTPNAVGEQTIEVIFTYREGNPIQLLAKTRVKKSVRVEGQVKQGLPAIMAIHAPVDVIFEYRNTSDIPATEIAIDKNIPKIFRETRTPKDCLQPGKDFPAHSICEIKGTFTPRNMGLNTISYRLSHAGGTVPPLETSTEVSRSRLVAVGEEGTILSSQNGKTWERKELPAGQRKLLNSVAWSPQLKQFLIVGAEGTILTYSEKKEGWKKRRSGTIVSLLKGLWNDDLKHYLVVGQSGFASISSDGIHWQAAGYTGTGDDLRTAIWNREQKKYVAVSGKALLTSPDGLIWTTVVRNTVVSKEKYSFRSIAWSPTQQQYILTTTAKNKLFISSDLAKWTPVENLSSNDWDDIIWVGSPMNVYAMLGSSTNMLKATSTIATSQDGQKWIWTKLPGSNLFLHSIVWDAGLSLFTTVGANGNIFTSLNGTQWDDSKACVILCPALGSVTSGIALSES